MKPPTLKIPDLTQVQIDNNPMPLWYSHWGLFHKIAFDIRQHVAKPYNDGGLNFYLNQNENTKRGVETLYGTVSCRQFLTPEGLSGVDDWIKQLCSLINLKTAGSQPIENLELVQTSQGFLAYYGKFYSNQMEIKLYIGANENIDGATVIYRKRSEVDQGTRKWDLLVEQLPLTVWVM